MFHYIPDIEQAVLDKLQGENLGVEIATREPATRPTEYVRIFLGSGGETTVPVHERFTITVEAWNRNRESKAAELANKLRTTFMRWGWERGQTLTGGGVSANIIRVDGGRPVNYPGADGWARFTATYQFTISH